MSKRPTPLDMPKRRQVTPVAGRFYTYRNLSVKDVGAPGWYVGGSDVSANAYGVLEWCLSEEDAKSVLTTMKSFWHFKDLYVGCDDDEDSDEIYGCFQ